MASFIGLSSFLPTSSLVRTPHTSVRRCGARVDSGARTAIATRLTHPAAPGPRRRSCRTRPARVRYRRSRSCSRSGTDRSMPLVDHLCPSMAVSMLVNIDVLRYTVNRWPHPPTPTSVSSRPRPIPTRLAIVRQLSGMGETCACDLGRPDISQPTLSHHLKVLREAGWVERRAARDVGLTTRSVRMRSRASPWSGSARRWGRAAVLGPSPARRGAGARRDVSQGAPIRVLFVCTGNSARSQIPPRRCSSDWEAPTSRAESAGTEPKGVEPLHGPGAGRVRHRLERRAQQVTGRVRGATIGTTSSRCVTGRASVPCVPRSPRHAPLGPRGPSAERRHRRGAARGIPSDRHDLEARLRPFIATAREAAGSPRLRPRRGAARSPRRGPSAGTADSPGRPRCCHAASGRGHRPSASRRRSRSPTPAPAAGRA